MAPAPAPDQPYRRERLRALVDHPDFGGVMAEAARFLGLRSGAYIRQMLEGERPITEKFIGKAESAHGGKYRGWFTNRTAEGDFIGQALEVLHAISRDPALCNRALGYLQGLADQTAASGGAGPNQEQRGPGRALAA